MCGSFVPQSLHRMQSPCPRFPGVIDIAGLVFQDADKAILLAEITNSKSEMMRQGRQVKLHVNRERFFDGTHGAERFSTPNTSAAAHRQDDFRFCAPANPGPIGHELVISHVIKKMWVVRAINATHMKCEEVGAFGS